MSHLVSNQFDSRLKSQLVQAESQLSHGLPELGVTRSHYLLTYTALFLQVTVKLVLGGYSAACLMPAWIVLCVKPPGSFTS